MIPVSVGVDVGGTKCWAVARTLDGDVLAERKRPTPAADHLVDALARLVVDATPPTAELVAVGVGVPGPVDRFGVLHTAAHVPTAAPVELQRRLQTAVGVPTIVDNDATLAAVAEFRLGAAAGVDNAIFVAFGTGIGAGLVIGGVVQRGANGFAGEPGHMIAVPNGRQCPCGRQGCWERYASGTGLAIHARERDLDVVDGDAVVAAAERGDARAIAALAAHGAWAGWGLAQLTTLLDPERYVIGGGMIDSARWWLAGAVAAHRREVFGGGRRPEPEIVPAALGPRAGAIGAALCAADLVAPVQLA